MQLRIVALGRKGNEAPATRKVIRQTCRQAYARLYGRQWEEKLRLLSDTSPAIAKKQCGEWSAEIETQSHLAPGSEGRGPASNPARVMGARQRMVLLVRREA
jgi:hypothetical protein